MLLSVEPPFLSQMPAERNILYYLICFNLIASSIIFKTTIIRRTWAHQVNRTIRFKRIVFVLKYYRHFSFTILHILPQMVLLEEYQLVLQAYTFGSFIVVILNCFHKLCCYFFPFNTLTTSRKRNVETITSRFRDVNKFKYNCSQFREMIVCIHRNISETYAMRRAP